MYTPTYIPTYICTYTHTVICRGGGRGQDGHVTPQMYMKDRGHWPTGKYVQDLAYDVLKIIMLFSNIDPTGTA